MFTPARSSRFLMTVLSVMLLISTACNRADDAAPSDATVQPESKSPSSDSGAEVAAGQATPDGKLAVGDKAPPLKLAKWLKGDPIDQFQDGHIYVVEFWATWCGPCRVSMPHISQLQQRLANSVTFIGISDEDEQTVRSFLASVRNPQSGETWDQVVTYAIALDADQAMHVAYMQAAGQRGIPTAFVVGRDGRIEWIGHPMGIEQPLDQIIAGTWDREAARAEFLQRQAAQMAQATLARALQAGQQTGDWTQAIETIDGLLAQQPDQDQLKFAKLSVLLLAKKFDEAQVLADQLAKENWDNAQLLNALAWSMATEIPQERRNYEAAARMATRASELTGGEAASILDTVARIYYEQGDLEKAVQWQRRAVARNAGGIQEINEALKKYEAELSGTAPSHEAKPKEKAPQPAASQPAEAPKPTTGLPKSNDAAP